MPETMPGTMYANKANSLQIYIIIFKKPFISARKFEQAFRTKHRNCKKKDILSSLIYNKRTELQRKLFIFAAHSAK